MEVGLDTVLRRTSALPHPGPTKRTLATGTRPPTASEPLTIGRLAPKFERRHDGRFSSVRANNRRASAIYRQLAARPLPGTVADDSIAVART
jgi:hypothetical protein